MVGLCMCGVSSVHLTTNKSDSKKEEALSFSHKSVIILPSFKMQGWEEGR